MASGMLGRTTSLHPNGQDIICFLEIDIDSEVQKVPIRVGYIKDGQPFEIRQSEYAQSVINCLEKNGYQIVIDPDEPRGTLLSSEQVLVLKRKPFQIEEI